MKTGNTGNENRNQTDPYISFVTIQVLDYLCNKCIEWQGAVTAEKLSRKPTKFNTRKGKWHMADLTS